MSVNGSVLATGLKSDFLNINFIQPVLRQVAWVIGVNSKQKRNINMKSIYVPDAPEAIGPYCHAMKVGNLLFCSGQTPLDPMTMEIVGTDIESQTKRVLQNLSIVLAKEKLSLENVVKTTVYLKDMTDFQGMNKTYAALFEGHKPSRTTISVKQNPLDALVEIECIAEYI